MTAAQGIPVDYNDAPPAPGDSFAEAWEDVRSDESIQFAEVEMPEAEPPPDWLTDFMEWLGSAFLPVTNFLVGAWPVLKWVLLALAIAGALYALIRILAPDLLARRRRVTSEGEWVPEQSEALALLEEADRLAAEGKYDAATHLLLKRSVGQIAAARPEIVEPSSTARELSAEPRIPEKARTAFGIIATRVERSLFALSALNREDWQVARDAYAEFALQQRALAG
ncbi:hypothetical protein [Erythrobacter sp. EC-HK427]|uniref:hypothetical protein n=1 Tax=Erythrobacter sp. EC-HK427 TaxID=2038396 RepID=UPI001252E912|nr:hypothetical protein [Erythrobacter sp. EC-HK427]VVS99258.1 conserved hypothetical protein [Erythrobacter sp. EC-HK427]